MFPQQTQSGSVSEVFNAFIKLGFTSFGGPVAHISYFRRELIEKRKWLNEDRYAQLVALCQFLPGPVSSQVGFAMGMIRAGWLGAISAFVAFTTPSVLLLLSFAYFLPALDSPLGQSVIHGLKLLAVAVVAHGVVTMSRKLTPDFARVSIAIAAAIAVLSIAVPGTQLLLIVAGAVLGALFLHGIDAPMVAPIAFKYSQRLAFSLLTLFLILLAASIFISTSSPAMASTAAFYRAGALVFGGGHVVLPLLQESIVTPGLISVNDFMAGYGAAQAVPGPMFSVAAFMGARIAGLVGAFVSVFAIFLPGFLLVAGTLPTWHAIASHQRAARAMMGVNSVVVGLLAAALYDPVWVSAVRDWIDIVIAASAFMMLLSSRVPLLAVIAWCVVLSIAKSALSPLQ